MSWRRRVRRLLRYIGGVAIALAVVSIVVTALPFRASAAEPLAGLGEVMFVEGGEKVVFAGKPSVERADRRIGRRRQLRDGDLEYRRTREQPFGRSVEAFQGLAAALLAWWPVARGHENRISILFCRSRAP